MPGKVQVHCPNGSCIWLAKEDRVFPLGRAHLTNYFIRNGKVVSVFVVSINMTKLCYEPKHKTEAVKTFSLANKTLFLTKKYSNLLCYKLWTNKRLIILTLFLTYLPFPTRIVQSLVNMQWQSTLKTGEHHVTSFSVQQLEYFSSFHIQKYSTVLFKRFLGGARMWPLVFLAWVDLVTTQAHERARC